MGRYVVTDRANRVVSDTFGTADRAQDERKRLKKEGHWGLRVSELAPDPVWGDLGTATRAPSARRLQEKERAAAIRDREEG